MGQSDISKVTKELVVQNANAVVDGLQFLNLMLADVVKVSKDEMFEQTKTHIDGSTVRAAALTIPYAFHGLFKVGAALAGGGWRHIVDVRDNFFSLWNDVFTTGQSFKDYGEMVRVLMQNLDIIPPGESAGGGGGGSLSGSLYCGEDLIFQVIPKEVGMKKFHEIVEQYTDIFKDKKFSKIQNQRSRAVFVFIFKMIFHCHEIRNIRQRFTLVAINGQTNAGKTTLVRELAGKDSTGKYVCKEMPGRNGTETTIFPKAYPSPTNPFISFIDLPGCTDADTFHIAAMFSSSSNLSVFVLKSDNPKNPTGPLSDIISKFIKERRGPCLICVNQFGQLFFLISDFIV